MTHEQAITILSQVQLTNEKEQEALILAIDTLSNHTNQPYITCKKCGERFRRVEEIVECNDMDFYDYACHCPKCGELYEWNNCYWR